MMTFDVFLIFVFVPIDNYFSCYKMYTEILYYHFLVYIFPHSRFQNRPSCQAPPTDLYCKRRLTQNVFAIPLSETRFEKCLGLQNADDYTTYVLLDHNLVYFNLFNLVCILGVVIPVDVVVTLVYEMSYT